MFCVHWFNTYLSRDGQSPEVFNRLGPYKVGKKFLKKNVPSYYIYLGSVFSFLDSE